MKTNGLHEETKVDAAKRMARIHFQVEPDLQRVFLLEPVAEDNPSEPIKLLEVVEGAVERGVEPVAFPPNPGRNIAFSSWIVELSPREFAQLHSREIVFRGLRWTVGQELPRS